jgi:hypothetical protein
VTNNASALSWTTGACKKSKVGRLLARFFCLLMIHSPLGINSKWISTDDNKIADNISRIKRVLSNPNNMAGILIYNLIKEEDIVRQRSPLDSKMYAEMP